MRGEGYEVIRRMVAERTDGQPFDDIEEVLPLAEADEIFSKYHTLVGQPRPAARPARRPGSAPWQTAVGAVSEVTDRRRRRPAPSCSARGAPQAGLLDGDLRPAR